MPVSAAAVTVRTAVPLMLPEVALMVDVPAATVDASPLLLTVAAARLLLDQITVAVQSALVLFE